jgi:hypothetical protein
VETIIPASNCRADSTPSSVGQASRNQSASYLLYPKGKVRLTVVSKIGREATIAIVNERNFFGEGALAGEVLRMGSAAAMTDCQGAVNKRKSRPTSLYQSKAAKPTKSSLKHGR